ncbi:protocadherin beta-2 isoform X1 [Octopus bimaculoides]|nr:protocadherin beta-2 isoform X1 [Octopus bimaculoides]
MLQVYILLIVTVMCESVDLTYHVKEGKRPGTIVGDISYERHLLDSVPPQDNGVITYSQLHESQNGDVQLFNVSKTGKLCTAMNLDAESLCKYNTECFRMVEIAVRQEEYFLKIIEIKVIIDDVNDNKPEFSHHQVDLQFYETDGKGTTKSIPNAIDKDVSVSNSQITYVLKNTNDPFKLSMSKSVIGTSKNEIILKQGLDREVKDFYLLEIIARDGGSPPKQSILKVRVTVTDENDSRPIFTQNIYNVSINKKDRRVQPVAIVLAEDKDVGQNGKVSYSFNSKTPDSVKSYFELDPKSGRILPHKIFPFEKRQTYKLFIDATDHGSPPLSSTAIVLINVLNQQNNAPRIDVKFVSKSDGNVVTISEGLKVGSFIAYVKVTDADSGHNGEVDCILNHEKFMLQSLGKNKYKVVIKSLVNRELESHMDLSIVCEDKGFPSLKTERKFSIEVMDINDVQPYFTKSTFKFLTYENEEPNFPVGFINATDPDLGLGGQLSYSLFDEHGYVLPFKISNFGFITTAQSLDHEKQDTYQFKALVKDNGTPSLNNTANVVVEIMDKNDNAPYFTFPSVSPFSLDVHYHPQTKSEITVLRASDRDSHANAFLRYEILGGNDKQLFTVNPYTGVLSFSRTVYQNDAGSYDLKFIVKDSGTPVLTATTTLSLTLTVSNTTARMYTAEDTESDNRIHINLMIIIVVAAVIVSVAIVVSVIVCVVHRKNQRDAKYGYGVSTNNDFVGERRPSGYISESMSSQYNTPVTMISDHNSTRISRTVQSGYKPGQSWKGSSSGLHNQDVTHQISVQEAAVTAGSRKEEQQRMLMTSDHFNEMLAISSPTNSGHGSTERNTVHYETLPGVKGVQLKLTPDADRKTLPQVLSRPRNSNLAISSSYQTSPKQFSQTNNVINLKTTQVDNANMPPTWNLPMRNSFTAYNKPLPKVPFS